MSLTIITGNIFTTSCQTIVNTVNCVGVMGAGLALECRLRYPGMYLKYQDLCKEHKIDIGLLWLYKSSDKWILNFPTKKDWKYPSKTEYLKQGLEKFVSTYEEKGIESVAFPLLGADKGGIPQEKSLQVMREHLEDAHLEIEIYLYDPTAKDDLYESTKQWLLNQDSELIKEKTKIKGQQLNKLLQALERDDIVQLNQLAKIEGIGIKTLERVFIAADSSLNPGSGVPNQQSSLFD